MRTRAERDGDHYVLNGTKLFITKGSQTAELVFDNLSVPVETMRTYCWQVLAQASEVTGAGTTEVRKMIIAGELVGSE
ncbi:MAG: hypothetical protein VYE73_18710 [Acidobacteriota bacterium]|nr:hypothetical protein [Acidobacteriota bacterium]